MYEDRPDKWSDPWVWVHGAPARSLKQVVDYLSGDAHDRSKVEFFDGYKFRPLEVGEL